MLLDSIDSNKCYFFILIVAKNTNGYENRGGTAHAGYTCLGVGGERSRGQGAEAGRRRVAAKGSARKEAGGLGRREGSSKTVPLQRAAVVAEGRGERMGDGGGGGHCRGREISRRRRPRPTEQDANGGGPGEA